MDFGQLFRRSWDIVWQNKYLFILGFLAALGAGGNGGSGVNYNFPSSSTSPTRPFPSDFANEVTLFWDQYGGLVLGLVCFFFVLGIIFWLIRLSAQGGLIEAVDRIESGEKMSFGKAFSAGVNRLTSLAGLNLLLNGPFILLGLIFAGIGGSFFVSAMRQGGELTEAMGQTFAILAACGGLLACLLLPIGLVVAIVLPFAQRGLLLQKMGVVESIRHGWAVVRNNIGDIIMLIIAFVVLGFLFGLVTAVFVIPFAFLAAGPFILDAIRGNEISFGMLEAVTLAFGGLCLGLVAAAVNSVMTAYRSTVVTLAYQQFIQKDG
ncbi:MAG: hypothetical protein KC449_24480 [Anaerolineales bacterium]|nr:hypothetical protein [Anaerolineales bacterium]